MNNLVKLGSIILVTMVAINQAAFAQSGSRFDGDWIGTIATPEGREFSVRIIIRGNAAQQFFRDENGWRLTSADRVLVSVDRNNAVVAWLNSGGVWTETQVFSLSYLSSNKLNLVWTRHVNNIRSGGDNESWNITGAGTLTRA